MAGQRCSSTMEVDTEAFRRGLAQHVAAMRIDGERGLARIGLRLQSKAKSLCPVDTGRLRSSITYAPGRDRLGPYVDVGTNVAYAPHVEFGTTRQRAQPFLRPALAEAVGYIPTELRQVGS